MSDYRAARRSEWTPERLQALSKVLLLTIAAGVVFGIFSAYANLYYVAAIAIGISMTLVVAWKFEAALLVYALVAFIPWGRTPDVAVGGSGVGKGLYVSELMLGYLVAIWCIRYLLGVLPKDRMKSGFYTPLGLYLAYSVICVANGFIFWDPHVDRIYQYPLVNVIELAFRILSVAALLMMATTLSNAPWARWTAIAAMIPGLYNVVNYLSGGKIPVMTPWWPLLMLLPAGYFWATALDPKASIPKRLVGLCIVGVALFAILIKNISWVSGWIGLIAALATITLIKSRKLFVALIIVVAVSLVAYKPFFHEKVIVESSKAGDYDRFALMKGAWRYATTFPLGVGPGNYRTYNSFYYGTKWGTTAYTSAHGTYSQHMSEMGIPGLVLFLAILVSGFIWLLRKYRRMPDGFARNFVLATMGQMVGISLAALIGDYIIPTYHNGGLVMFSSTVYSWLVWGLAVAQVRLGGVRHDGSLGINSQLEHM